MRQKQWIALTVCMALLFGGMGCGPSGRVSMVRFDASNEEAAAVSAMMCYDSLDKGDRAAFVAVMIAHAGVQGKLEKLHGMTASDIVALAYQDTGGEDLSRKRRNWRLYIMMREKLVRGIMDAQIRVTFRSRNKSQKRKIPEGTNAVEALPPDGQEGGGQ